MVGTRLCEPAADLKNMVDKIFYFAYGSNLCRSRLHARIGHSPVIGVAALLKHRLAFHKNGQDGSAKCDAFYTDNDDDLLWGAVYAITSEQKEALDEFEGVGNGYEVKRERIILQNIHAEVIFYTAHADHIDTKLLPFDWYHAYVLHGARSHNLPGSYVESIRRVVVRHDQDNRRVAKNKQILELELG